MEGMWTRKLCGRRSGNMLMFVGFAPEGTGCGQSLVTGTQASFRAGSALAQARALSSRLYLRSAGDVGRFISAWSIACLQVAILQIGALVGSSAFVERGIKEHSAHLAQTITTGTVGCAGRALSVPIPLLL